MGSQKRKKKRRINNKNLVVCERLFGGGKVQQVYDFHFIIHMSIS